MTQRLQMISVIDENVHNIALDGTFDDCQVHGTLTATPTPHPYPSPPPLNSTPHSHPSPPPLTPAHAPTRQPRLALTLALGLILPLAPALRQAHVKSLFNDPAFRTEHRLAAVNSINWARILAQIVYYVHAYLKVTTPTPP